ncbi:DsbC family protein [Pectobacterium carotovorum subsp. carotovorum]|nr:DsbC family protein [Pectobacterium carotovorum]MCL6336319.1 DsbC family protein [Pectobacterium carotovorum subsp. carotovorum]
MNHKNALIAAAITFGLTASFAHAQNDKNTELTEAQTLKAAQDQLGASFSNMTISGFSESPIKGIYEVKTGGNIIYFYPGTHGGDGSDGILLLGEMYTPAGVSLTAQSKANSLSDTIKSLPLDSAITFGPKDAPVFYEFTDPDCPYCHAYDEWIKTYSKDHPVQRKLIFFNNPSHPLARAKMEHIICSKDKEEAYRYVFSDELPHNPSGANSMQMAKQKALKTCKEAEEVLSKHAEIIQAVGVNGTPSFLFNIDSKPNLIVGYDKQKIAAAITEIEKTEVSKASKTK